MVKNEFKISFSSNIYITKEIVNNSLNFIKENIPNLSNEDLYDLKLILCELIFNAVIHGNKEDIKKNVSLSIEIEKNIVYISITDEGPGFDYMKLLNKLHNSDNLFDENGRGIKLVLSLVDNISFNICGNEIKIHKKVALNG